MTAPAIGIDLGTTYSCAAVYRNGQAEVIANSLGNRVTPSVVAFGSERLIGDAAREKEALNPENTIFDVKRLIGRRYDDPTIQRDLKLWPFEVVNDNGRPKVRVTHQGKQCTFFPEEISAMVLGSMKTTAERFLGKAVRNAVITVPAHFTDSQRQATKDAATIAGLKVLRIINEPTAAALAYGIGDTDGEERLVLVFDLGGGTFDVSLLAIEESIFEVRSTAGDTHLGGTDFDARLMEHFAAEFENRHGINLRGDNYALRRLRTSSERAKRTLSVANEASIELDALHAGKDFSATITRARFEELCSDLFRSTLEPVRAALRDAELKASEIDEIVLVGGSSRIPAVQALLREIFPNKTFAQTVNPDEAVAIGAAVQAAVLDGDRSETVTDLVLVDVTPLSLGVEVSDGSVSVIIPRNTTIPVRKTKGGYSTVYNYQTGFDIKVYEGERKMAKDNHLLGKFYLSDIYKAPRGVPQLQLTFEIDSDGILQVSAIEKLSNKENNITIKYEKGRLSTQEIEKLIKEAEAFKSEDERKKAAAAAKNDLERKCFDVRKRVNKNPSRTLQKVLEKVEEILLWLNSASPSSKEVYEQKGRELDILCELSFLRI